jgi:pyrimidine-specific ribonucleoside hydrolase
MLTGSGYGAAHPKPLIIITDLYHPFQDPGDNLDLIMGFANPQVELRAIILDITDSFRKRTADHPTLWKDPRGPREAGIIPVMQLNYIFDRNVPFAMGPLKMMRSETDKMEDISSFEQEGVRLLLRTLKESKTPVEILSFGSARVLSVAYNRAPVLCKAKISKIHLSAGTASPDFKLGKDEGANGIPGGEWNVALDVFAFNRILRSGLPIALYPCAGIDGGFVKDPYNTYWQLASLDFLAKADPRIQRYLDFALAKEIRYDFLSAMDVNDQPFQLRLAKYPRPFHFWETALWMNVLDLELVKRAVGDYSLISKKEVKTDDVIIKTELIPSILEIHPDGRFTFKKTTGKTSVSIFHRADPIVYEKALQEAFPGFFAGFKTGLKKY